MTKKRVVTIVGILFAVLALLFAARANHAVEHQIITVVFRYDDYSERSPTSLEADLIAAFQEHDIPCTLGIIPYVSTGVEHDPYPQRVMPLSQEKAAILKEAVASGIVEPALHGYSHQTVRDCPRDGRGCTEFVGSSYIDQLAKIGEGKRLLEDKFDARISTFIPPWNSYDENTLRCVEELGFNCLSAASQGVSEKDSSLKFLPATCSISALRQAVRRALGAFGLGYVSRGCSRTLHRSNSARNRFGSRAIPKKPRVSCG
jgi:peptidoglycan/xylan/chitin deacetylase (PgdA/CDA1 family)